MPTSKAVHLMSMPNTSPVAGSGWQHQILSALKRSGVEIIAYVPDAAHAVAIREANEDPDMTAVSCTTEEECIAICDEPSNVGLRVWGCLSRRWHPDCESPDRHSPRHDEARGLAQWGGHLSRGHGGEMPLPWFSYDQIRTALRPAFDLVLL